MNRTSLVRSLAGRTILAAGALAVASSAVLAGECPAGKSRPDGQKASTAAAKGVTDKVIGSIDLANEAPRLANHKLRLRRLVVQPGGIVPWHSHGDRPAIITIVSGTIVEYRSTCAVPIIHRAGDVAVEIHTTSHWWKNNGRRPAVLLSSDILHDKADHKTM